MSLPIKIMVPTFDVVVPSSQKTIKCRPYLVKEDKILLMALQSESELEVLNAIEQIVNNCIVDLKDQKFEELAIFDYEYIILQLRIRSKGEKLTIKYSGIETECEKCKKPKAIDIDLTSIKVSHHPNHKNMINLTDNVQVKMCYPKFDYVKKSIKEKPEVEKTFELVVECIDSIITDDAIYTKKEVGENEIQNFIEGLTTQQFDLLYNFVETIPALTHEIDLSCSECGRVDVQKLVGLHDFFL